MPIYEYRCTKCGDLSEVMQRVSDPPKRKCRNCSGRLEKLISRTAFHLKGGGWFSEDYTPGSKEKSKEKKKQEAKGESSTPAESSKSTEKKASSA